MTVLIVDDDPVACEHARLVLKKAGITAEIASSGAEAVELSQLPLKLRDGGLSGTAGSGCSRIRARQREIMLKKRLPAADDGIVGAFFLISKS